MNPMVSRSQTIKLPAKLKVEYMYWCLRCRICDGLGKLKIQQLGIGNEGKKPSEISYSQIAESLIFPNPSQILHLQALVTILYFE